MAIELIDKIKQKNNGGFELGVADEVDWGGTGEKSVKERIEELESETGNVEAITTEDIDDILSR